jgi:zinc transporter 9
MVATSTTDLVLTGVVPRHKTSETVRKRLDSERKRLEKTKASLKPTAAVGGEAGDSSDVAETNPELSQLVGSLREQRAKLQADDARKLSEIDGLRLTAIQGHLPNSTSSTLMVSLMGNCGIAAAKFYAYSRTGHQAMLSEAIHTCVDVGNQAILAYGLREAARAPDKRYQYGYGRAAFFYSLLSALSTFGFGACLTLYQGVDAVVHPAELLEPLPETWAVLAVSFAVDGLVLSTAMKDVWKRAAKANVTAFQWIFMFKDPFTVAVVFEDSAAVIGVAIAAAGIGMTQLTGSPVWDGISAVCIATLLGAVSLKLIQLNRSFILGKPVDREITDGIRKILLRRRSVDAVYAAQTQWIGPSAFAYNAEVDFDGTYLAAQVYSRYELEISNAAKEGKLRDNLRWLLPCFAEDVTRVLEKEVRDIQAEVRAAYREASFIDIVPDSSQTFKSALEHMHEGSVSRQAEHGVLLALLKASKQEAAGDGHEQTHAANFNLGCAYYAMGHYEKAVRPLQLSLSEREVLHGSEIHVEVAAALEALGAVYCSLHEHLLAHTTTGRAISILQQLDDPTKVSAEQTGYVRGLLARAHETHAQILSDQGQPGAAYAPLVAALEIRREVHGGHDARLAATLALLGRLCGRLPAAKHGREAISHLEEAVAILQHQRDPDHLRIGRLMVDLGNCFLRGSDPAEAAARFTDGLALVEANTMYGSLEVAAVQVKLAAAHQELGQLDEAMGLLWAAHDTQAAKLKKGDPALHQVKNTLITLCNETGRDVPERLFDT